MFARKIIVIVYYVEKQVVVVYVLAVLVSFYLMKCFFLYFCTNRN